VRILLDECVPHRLRRLFADHDCHTAAYAGFLGLTNGKLLTAGEADGFDVLVTNDQRMQYQQSMSGRRISLIVMCSPVILGQDLATLIPAILDALRTIQPGEIVIIN
jgi:predicted nuclease of predicted toxin-antitoxin system